MNPKIIEEIDWNEFEIPSIEDLIHLFSNSDFKISDRCRSGICSKESKYAIASKSPGGKLFFMFSFEISVPVHLFVMCEIDCFSIDPSYSLIPIKLINDIDISYLQSVYIMMS